MAFSWCNGALDILGLGVYRWLIHFAPETQRARDALNHHLFNVMTTVGVSFGIVKGLRHSMHVCLWSKADAVRVAQEQERIIHDMGLECGEMKVGDITRKSISPGINTCMHGNQTISKMKNNANKAICDGCGAIIGNWADFS